MPTMISCQKREEILRQAHFNVFKIPSQAVALDLLTDSGTGVMSPLQWERMRGADEAYAGSISALQLTKLITECFTTQFVHLVPQGRCAENVFNEFVLNERGMVVLGNTPFDTTRLHMEKRGAIIEDCTAHKPVHALGSEFQAFQGFLGDVDIGRLKQMILHHRYACRKIAYIFITATCNSNGGQPVSLGNIREASAVARQFNVPIFLDLARYAENAYFIKNYESACHNLSISEIVQEMVSGVDGFLASGKKDALGNIGGFMGVRSAELSEQFSAKITFDYGLDSMLGGYGGLAGYSMEALRQGINESMDEEYLGRRIAQVANLARKLHDIGIPVLPPGGHAVFVDAGRFLPHLQWHEFPGHALALELYREGGIRSVEVGSLMLGPDPNTASHRRASQELLRMAIPRRKYSDEELELVVRTFARVKERRSAIGGVAIDKDSVLRHFAGHFHQLT